MPSASHGYPATPATPATAAPLAERANQQPAPRPDLLLTSEELLALGHSALERGDRRDAFLTVAGVSQIIDDYLDGLDTSVRQVSGLVAQSTGIATALPRAGVAIAQAVMIRRRRSSKRLQLQRQVWALTNALTNNPGHPAREIAELTDIARRLAKQSTSLRRSLARSPSCFRSFDQHPDDLAVQVERYAAALGTKPAVLVVGLRTSGSFLAPLCAEQFRRAGFGQVTALSYRPGARLGPDARRQIKNAIRIGARCVLVDDPPASGSALREAADELISLGLASRSLTLFVPLMGSDEPPVALAGLDVVALPAAQWSIMRRLSFEEVTRALHHLLPTVQLDRLELLMSPSVHARRGHFAALYRVSGTDERGRFDYRLQVQGVGYGYFGQFDSIVRDALPDHVATRLGVYEGVSFVRLGSDLQPTERDLVDYVTDRADALAVPDDRSTRIRGRQPAWEVASNEISAVFGRLWPAARLLTVEPLVKRLLTPDHCAVVDGGMREAAWTTNAAGHATKIDTSTRTFSNLDLACYDPVYDLVGASMGQGFGSYDARVRRDFELHTQQSVSRERWLLYQLVHLWDAGRAPNRDAPHLARLRASAVRNYLAAAYLSDVTCPERGPLCALDIDGVVESDAMGFAAPTAQSLLALRALCRHGVRPVLVTGRGFAEVQDRRRDYPVAGIVAEYGGSVGGPDGDRHVLTPEESHDLAVLRRRLVADSRVHLDDDRVTSLRCVVRRGTASAEQALHAIEEALADNAGAFRVIGGDAQFDLVPERITKATGLRELCDALDERRIELAVGDTASDAVMLAMASRAVVPAHADSSAKAAAHRVSPHPYQRGLADAVGELIGHEPGGCASCALGRQPRDAVLLQRMLSAAQGSRADLVREMLALSLTVRHRPRLVRR